MDEILFTPASLIDLLSQIEELSNVDVKLIETGDSNIQLTVGSSTYDIPTRSAEVIDVPQQVVEDIGDVNEETYSSLTESNEVSVETDPEVVQSGIIKQVAKTLLIGGMVRLSAKLLKN